METSPYETPESQSEPPRNSGAVGRPCPSCGSVNTGRDMLSRSRPNILFVIFFGWVFLLIRGAFAIRTDHCRDCGGVNRYKSIGSWIALVVLIFLILCVAAVFFQGDLG